MWQNSSRQFDDIGTVSTIYVGKVNMSREVNFRV